MISIISIVKEDRRIDNLLDKLIKIKKPEKTEIIVIDASKKERLLDIKNKFPNVKWFYYNNKKGKKITIPEQRNMGIKKSNGEIIVFIDTDCLPSKSWLTKLVNPILKGKESFCAGYIKLEGGGDLNNSKDIYVNDAGNGNLAYTRKLIKKIGYYDEDFSVSEDRDFCIRAIKAGYKIRFIKSAIVFHPKDKIRKLLKNSFIHGKSTCKIYKKHLDKDYLVNFKKRFIQDLFYPTFMFLLPITLFFPYYLLFLIIPFFKNINKNPLIKIISGFLFGFGFLNEIFFPGDI